MYKLCFFVPASHLEAVKEAVFAAGAGRYQHYDRCAWQTLGRGQFRPLPGNRAFVGITGVLSVLDEYKVEMICVDEVIAKAVAALRQAHPFEEPAYEVYQLCSEF